MSIHPRDILFYGGGTALVKYGTLSRRTTTIARGGEDQIETFTRSGAGASFVARDGTIQLAGANVPRPHWIDADADDALDTCVLLLEDTAENLVAESDDLSDTTGGAGWDVSGGASATAAQVTCGAFNLASVEDNSGAATETLYTNHDLGFTGDGVKCCAVIVGVDLDNAPSESQIAIRDVTNNADRATMSMTWDANGKPTVTADTGTLQYGPIALANDCWLVYFATTSISMATSPDHRFYVRPASANDADTGIIYVGGCTATDLAAALATPIQTTGAAVTRAVQSLTFPWNVPPQAMTVYVKFLERESPNWSQSAAIAQIGAGDNSTPRLLLYKPNGTDTYRLYHDPSTSVNSSVDLNPSIGDMVEVRGVLNGDGSVQMHGALNGGSESSGSASAAQAFSNSMWADSKLYVGNLGSGARCFTGLEALIFARGTGYTLADFRALLP